MSSAPDAPPRPISLDEVFTPKLDPRFALGLPHVLLTAWLGSLFLLANWFPLRTTDLWCHVNYGHWILDHQGLPERDPFFPLAGVTPVIDYAWLSQVLLAGLERAGGAAWLSNAFALTLLATQSVLAWTFYRQSRSAAVVLLGSVAAVLVGWSRIATIRPENFAALAFAVLLAMIIAIDSEDRTAGHLNSIPGRRVTWLQWLGVPLLLATWTNLHGSFVCGLAVLGCFLLGRLIETAWQRRSLRAALTDRVAREWFGLCVLAVTATLVNPYGLNLLRFTLAFVNNPNLGDIQEWQPLAILGPGGREFALSWVVLLLVLRHSRRPVPVAHALLLGVFGTAAAFGVRMLGWYAAVYAVVLVPHLADLWRRLFPSLGLSKHGDSSSAIALAAESMAEAVPTVAVPSTSPRVIIPPGRSFWYSLVCLLLVWIGFALAPISFGVLGRESRPPEQLYGPSTPWHATQHLLAHPHQGRAFHPIWWGDWLRHEGPEELLPFLGMNVHLVPPGVWRDYLHISGGFSGWQSILDRYQVDTLVLDRNVQPVLRSAACRSPLWRVTYEDAQATILTRHIDPQPAGEDRTLGTEHRFGHPR